MITASQLSINLQGHTVPLSLKPYTLGVILVNGPGWNATGPGARVDPEKPGTNPGLLGPPTASHVRSSES